MQRVPLHFNACKSACFLFIDTRYKTLLDKVTDPCVGMLGSLLMAEVLHYVSEKKYLCLKVKLSGDKDS